MLMSCVSCVQTSCVKSMFKEQGCSRWSACHMWVDFFIGSPLYSEGFLSDFLVFIPSQLKFTRDNLNLIRPRNSEPDEPPRGCPQLYQFFFDLCKNFNCESKVMCDCFCFTSLNDRLKKNSLPFFNQSDLNDKPIAPLRLEFSPALLR